MEPATAGSIHRDGTSVSPVERSPTCPTLLSAISRERRFVRRPRAPIRHCRHVPFRDFPGTRRGLQPLGCPFLGDHTIMKCRCLVRGSLYEPSGGVRWSGNRGSGDSAETDACASPSLEPLAWCLSGASPGGLWSNGDSRHCSIACNRCLTALQKRSASLRSTRRPSPVPSRLIGDVVLARLDDPKIGLVAHSAWASGREEFRQPQVRLVRLRPPAVHVQEFWTICVMSAHRATTDNTARCSNASCSVHWSGPCTAMLRMPANAP